MNFKDSLFNFLIPFFSLQKNLSTKYPLSFLNIAQFGGVLNDNLYKFLMVFLLIDKLGINSSTKILFWTGTIYVIPFLLFASLAGYLADKFSKQKLIILIKFIEIIVMSLGALAFAAKSQTGCYSVLFLLSTHSAFFGPPKFSIIPEIVKKEEISKANGIITSFAYLAIIVGTFLASSLTQITGRNFKLSILVCILISIVGFFCSICIPKTLAKPEKRKFNYLFPYQILKNLLYTRTIKKLLLVIISASTFLFTGAFFQLNIIPYAIESLHLTEIGGGYLFLITSIGIALGSMMAGKISKNRIELGLSCIGGLGITLLFSLLAFIDFSLISVLIVLVLIGVFGGFFIVPLDSFVQYASPIQKRGEIIAVNYFLSFLGVLLAPFCLVMINQFMGLKAAQGFGIVGIGIFLLSLVLLHYLSDDFFHFILRMGIFPFFKPNTEQYPPITKPFALILPEPSFLKIGLLLGTDPNMHFFSPKNRKGRMDGFISTFFPITFIYCEGNNEFALGYFFNCVMEMQKRKKVPCLLFKDRHFLMESFTGRIISDFTREEHYDLFFTEFPLIPHAKKGKMGSRIERQITLIFTKALSIQQGDQLPV